jgi:hypothetical protein
MTIVEYAWQDGGWHGHRIYTWSTSILVRRGYRFDNGYYDSCMDFAVAKCMDFVVAKSVGDGIFLLFLRWYQ